MRGAAIEFISESLLGGAMALVAKAASVPEDGEGADVAFLGLESGLLISVRVVDKDASLIRRSRVVDVVENKICAADCLKISWELEWLGLKRLHELAEADDVA
jgi:hypothetical protein